MKKILIINGHPNAESFSFGIAEAYKKGALSAGAEVQEIVIRDLKFNPRSNPGASKKAVPTQMPVWIIVVPPNIWTVKVGQVYWTKNVHHWRRTELLPKIRTGSLGKN